MSVLRFKKRGVWQKSACSFFLKKRCLVHGLFGSKSMLHSPSGDDCLCCGTRSNRGL